MRDDNDWFGTLLGCVFLGGMYAWGNSNGQKKMVNYYENQRRDQEIEALKKELAEIKRLSHD